MFKKGKWIFSVTKFPSGLSYFRILVRYFSDSSRTTLILWITIISKDIYIFTFISFFEYFNLAMIWIWRGPGTVLYGRVEGDNCLCFHVTLVVDCTNLKWTKQAAWTNRIVILFFLMIGDPRSEIIRHGPILLSSQQLTSDLCLILLRTRLKELSSIQ